MCYTLYGRLSEPKALVEAFRKVKRSKGAPGIDGQSVDQFEADLGTDLRQLRGELQEKSYRPLPVKRVEIPKPDGGVRKLGIPAVRDRIVQQMVLDILQPIFASSSKGAQGRMSEVVEFLEEELKLVVNREKTELTTAREGVKFLGVVIHRGYTRVQEKKRKAFKARVKAAARRTSQVNPQKVIADINPLLRGYAHYFRVANCQEELERLTRWIRHRLRAKQMQLWKKPDRLHRQLRKMGYKGSFERVRMQSWRTSSCSLSHMAMPRVWFDDSGLFDMSSVQTGYSVPGV